MKPREKRKEWMGVVGTLGTAVLLAGLLAGLMPLMVTIVASVSIWMVGATLVIALTDPPK